jgi:hypothetical protein
MDSFSVGLMAEVFIFGVFFGDLWGNDLLGIQARIGLVKKVRYVFIFGVFFGDLWGNELLEIPLEDSWTGQRVFFSGQTNRWPAPLLAVSLLLRRFSCAVSHRSGL